MNETIKEIILALLALDVKGSVKIRRFVFGRMLVYVNGMEFGIWDIRRKTFID
jgi:hypothetical protein